MRITWEVADKSCRLGMALIMKCRYLLWVLEWAHNYTLIRVRIPLIYDGCCGVVCSLFVVECVVVAYTLAVYIL